MVTAYWGIVYGMAGVYFNFKLSWRNLSYFIYLLYVLC